MKKFVQCSCHGSDNCIALNSRAECYNIQGYIQVCTITDKHGKQAMLSMLIEWAVGGHGERRHQSGELAGESQLLVDQRATSARQRQLLVD